MPQEHPHSPQHHSTNGSGGHGNGHGNGHHHHHNGNNHKHHDRDIESLEKVNSGDSKSRRSRITAGAPEVRKFEPDARAESKSSKGSKNSKATTNASSARIVPVYEDEDRLGNMRRNDTFGNVFTGKTSLKKALRAKLILSGVADHPKSIALKKFLRGKYFGTISMLCEFGLRLLLCF